jgi:NADP-reducing hydrogenase subunit HndB
MTSKISIDDLAKIRDTYKRTMNIREGAGRAKITVHMDECGLKAGAENILKAVMKEIDDRKLDDIIVTNSGCAGQCSHEPMITVEVFNEPAAVRYGDLSADKIKKIFESHIIKGQLVKEYALALSEAAV